MSSLFLSRQCHFGLPKSSKVSICSNFVPPNLCSSFLTMVKEGSFLITGTKASACISSFSASLGPCSFYYYSFSSFHSLLPTSYQHFNMLSVSNLKKNHLSEFQISLQLLTHVSPHFHRKTSRVFYSHSFHFLTSHS